MLETPGERLKWAREDKFKRTSDPRFKSARAAALSGGIKEPTYRSHEATSATGARGYAYEDAQTYGRWYGVNPIWLLTGTGEPRRQGIRIIGLAGAGPGGSVEFLDPEGELDEAPLIVGVSPDSVAVEVRGDSMRGIAEDGWIVYYEDVHDPPTADLIGEVCVVGLSDGPVLIKKLYRGRDRNTFDLESAAAPTMRDVRLAWAAPVTAILPRRTVRRLRGSTR